MIQMRRSIFAVAVCGAIGCAGITAPGVALAQGKRPAKLAAVYGVAGDRVLHVSGFAATARPGARALLEVRRSGKLRTVRSARVRSKGKFAVKWRYPRSSKTLNVRVRVTKSRRSKRTVAAGSLRTLRVAGIRRGARRAPVKTRQIISLPPAETGGRMVLLGRPRVRKGDVVVLGASQKTPAGVLQRVVRVARAGKNTVLTTKPASLPDVIPVGSMDVQLPRVSAPRVATLSSTKKGAAVSCTAGKTMNATADVDLRAGTSLQATWGPFSGLKAKFTANAGASAALDANISGKASCELKPVGVFPKAIGLGTYPFSIAGFPIVLRPEGQVYLSGKAQVDAAMKTSAYASLTANAGISYDDGFKPFGSVTPETSFSPPTITAGGSAELHAAPTVFVKINGIAGPEVDMKAGLKLVANTTANPWWTLTAPLSAGVKFKLDVLKIKKESKRYQIYGTEPVLATSGGPFGSPTPPLPDPAPPPTDPAVGNGVTQINSETTGSPEQSGNVSGFVPGQNTFVLDTGNLSDATVDDPSFEASTDLGGPGDAGLSALVGTETHDAATYTVNVKPEGDTLHVDYIFASEEYPEYVGAGYDDVMAVYVNGTNCAFVPGTNERVSVDSINDHTNSQYYVDNQSGAAGYHTSMDGITKPLRCSRPVTPGQPVQVKIAIADTGDAVLDSVVGLLNGGISSD